MRKAKRAESRRDILAKDVKHSKKAIKENLATIKKLSKTKKSPDSPVKVDSPEIKAIRKSIAQTRVKLGEDQVSFKHAQNLAKRARKSADSYLNRANSMGKVHIEADKAALNLKKAE